MSDKNIKPKEKNTNKEIQIRELKQLEKQIDKHIEVFIRLKDK
ncbi:hypothetical protein ACWOB1_01605 [Facklamia languida]|uniref:Uncharacterized protein n=1 Tax=Facklamia languida CCUG 37842 TaxID=883113 RepID=H3NH78_9LACT|nr:hypothetical protein [Facklamia languida]EHR38133.1 hypothetical protein HMPREF9708_00217 [Facklamia languida CCUG 37842]